MQSHTTLPTTLQQSLEKHPNVIYKAKPLIPSVIDKETFNIITLDKIHKYMSKLMVNPHELNRALPNLFTIKTSGVFGVTEREAHDYRISRFKSKEPNSYNTFYSLAIEKITEIQEKELELADILAKFKESTNLSFEQNYKRKL